MKKKNYKLVILMFCMLLLFLCIVTTINICDLHISSHIHTECTQCLLVQSTRELIRNIYIIEVITMLFITLISLNTDIRNLKFDKYITPILMKVRLNE